MLDDRARQHDIKSAAAPSERAAQASPSLPPPVECKDWAASLESPCAKTAVDSSPSDDGARPSLLKRAFEGNFQNFGMSTAATAFSATIAALCALAAEYGGASDVGKAAASWVGSYSWYPAYWLLNHLYRDRETVQMLKEAGDTGSPARMWGSRIMQSAIGEALWFGLVVPGQIYLARKFGLGGVEASLAAHIPAALLMNIAILTPIRNISQMVWRVERPPEGHE